MSKYIIKNCPCYNKDYSCQSKDNSTGKYCQDCTDCVLKQIVEKCKERTVGFIEEGVIKEEILQLFDIEEVE